MQPRLFAAETIALLLLEQLHAGPRAVVYGARDDGRALAVKAGARAHTEAKLLAKSAHPNIAACLYVGRLDDGAPAYVSPRYAADLASHIRAHGPLGPGAALSILKDMAAGLVRLHGLGLRHGDVQPANVLLRADGSAVLADLEFAAPLDGAAAGPAPGVFDYLAPEAVDGLALDARADVYGLAAVGWAMLTGRPPAPLEPPVGPGGLSEFLETCLAPDRALRPADGAAALRLLDRLGAQ